MSNKLRAIFLSIAMVFTLNAKNSQASLGISFSAPFAVVAGVAALAIGGVAAYGGYRVIKNGTPGSTGAAVAAFIFAAAGGYFGVILLDGEQEAKFAELSPAGQLELGLSSEERKIYNSEIEQVNAIAREIGAELEVQGDINNVELARDLRIKLGTQLSPETMKTLIAIASQK